MEQLLYWLAGGVGVPLIQWLKKAFGLDGIPALWVTLGVSIALAVAALFITRQLSLDDFTPMNLLAVFGQVVAAATVAYKLLVQEEVPENA
ncbi:MAG: hypothetical protein JXB38_20440 [Anaerolineales bacterium]|nr:hypothetical protein [Anaerolineales bacterium]